MTMVTFIVLSGGTFRGHYIYGDYGGGSDGVRTTRVGGGGFLATETATRYVPGHTPSRRTYVTARNGPAHATVQL